MPMVGPVHDNLRYFRFARGWRWDDFVDGAGHGGTWLLCNSCRILIQLRYSCGFGDARLPHFFLDTDTCSVFQSFLAILRLHAPNMAPIWKSCSPILYSDVAKAPSQLSNMEQTPLSCRAMNEDQGVDFLAAHSYIRGRLRRSMCGFPCQLWGRMNLRLFRRASGRRIRPLTELAHSESFSSTAMQKWWTAVCKS